MNVEREFETEVVNGFTYLVTADGRRLQVPSGGSPEGEEEQADAEGDKGGVGDDAPDDDADADAERATAGDDGDATDKGEKKAGNAGLQKRLKSVIEQRNKYRELGTPEELQALKAKAAEYAKYERQIEAEEREAADEAARKAGKPTAAEQNAALDRMLNQRFGDGATEDFQAFRETRKREIARHTRDGLEYLKGKLTEHNLKADDDTVASWERHIGTELMGDDALRAQFRDPVTQRAALDEAFTRVRRGLIDPSLAAVGAEKLSKAKARREAAPGSGGSGGGTTLPDQFENLTPPKGLTADQRTAWWDKQMQAATNAMDNW